jgi:hypothetical protein
MEPAPSINPSAPAINGVPLEPQDGLAESMPPLPPPVSPAKAWTDPPPGIHHGLSIAQVLEITSCVDLRKKASIYDNITFARRDGVPVKDLRKPPNHVMAGKDFPTTLCNLKKWGSMTEEEQQLQIRKAQVLTKSQQKRMLKLLAEINPAQVLPAPGQDTQQSASGNEASSTSMDVDGEADPPAPPAGDGPPAGDAPPARQVVPHNHVGIMSSTADRAALLQEREKQVYEYRHRKTASPAKKESL